MHHLRDMLYSKYQNPLSVLASQTLTDAVDFVFYLFDKETEEKIHGEWLAGYLEHDWPYYKPKYAIRERLKQKATTIKSDSELIDERLAGASNTVKFK